MPQVLGMQGPAAIAWKLVTDAACTEEQLGRPDKTAHPRPVAPATGNHRVVCLGGGGVGKTRTLSKVVEPMAITYFGDQGYLGKAQSNHAAHNLEQRARTMHSSSGPLMADPCRPTGCA